MTIDFFRLASRQSLGYRKQLVAYTLTTLFIMGLFYFSVSQLLLNPILVLLLTWAVMGSCGYAIFHNYLSYLHCQKQSYLLSIYAVCKKIPHLYALFFFYWFFTTFISSFSWVTPYLHINHLLKLVIFCLWAYTTLFYFIASLSLLDPFETKQKIHMNLIYDTHRFIGQHSYFLFKLLISLIGSFIFFIIIIELIWPCLSMLCRHFRWQLSFDNYYRTLSLSALFSSIPFMISLLTHLYLLKRNPLIHNFRSPYLSN